MLISAFERNELDSALQGPPVPSCAQCNDTGKNAEHRRCHYCRPTKGAFGTLANSKTVHKKRVRKAHREENTRLVYNKTKKKRERVKLGSYIPLREWAVMASKKDTELGHSCMNWLTNKGISP
jgi:hypothetical protein